MGNYVPYFEQKGKNMNTFGSFGQIMQNTGQMISNTVNNAANKYMGFANMGSTAANAVSRAAQENQFAFNSAEAAINRDYNTQMWEEQKNFNAEEAAKNRDFQAAEAEKTREWQEKLANTSYQRAVEDLKKAGLNPILAYMNGATTPSGATASGSSASASLASGSAASGSNYTGQGTNMSEMLAIMGVLGSMLGEGMSALGQWFASDSGRSTNGYRYGQDQMGLFSAYHPAPQRQGKYANSRESIHGRI